MSAREKIEKLHRRGLVLKCNGMRVADTSVKRIIPKIGNDKKVYDVEILVNKSKNSYFSLSCFLKGNSWVNEIELLEWHDQRLTKQTPIARYITEQMTEEHYDQTLEIIENAINNKRFRGKL